MTQKSILFKSVEKLMVSKTLILKHLAENGGQFPPLAENDFSAKCFRIKVLETINFSTDLNKIDF